MNTFLAILRLIELIIAGYNYLANNITLAQFRDKIDRIDKAVKAMQANQNNQSRNEGAQTIEDIFNSHTK